MNLPVYLYGQSVLRKTAEAIDKNYENLGTLIDNMFQTMYHSDGVGLAAPQIGLPIRLIVLDGDVMRDDFPECKDFKRILINPEIIEYGKEKITYDEGCLSLPGIHEAVTRPVSITVKYLDENFQEKQETLHGFDSRIVQHEYDHLLGKLFIDHISPIRKQLIKGKLNNIIKGRIRCGYPTKMQNK